MISVLTSWFLTAVSDGELVIADDLVEKLRSIKSSAEIAMLEHAATIADASFRTALEVLDVALTEAEVTAALVSEATRRDAVVANAFVTTFGDAANVGHDGAPTWSQRKLQEGDLFTVDFSGAYRSYFFDVARSRVIGRPPTDAQAAAFELAKDSVNTAVAAAVPALRWPMLPALPMRFCANRTTTSTVPSSKRVGTESA